MSNKKIVCLGGGSLYFPWAMVDIVQQEELAGAELTRVPKGFDGEHPSADLVRCKQWLLDVALDPGLAVTPKLYEELVKRFRAMTPFVEFLNAPLVASLGLKRKVLFGLR